MTVIILNSKCIFSLCDFRKSLNHAYELMVLQEGDFDERVFLHAPIDTDLNCISSSHTDAER